MKAKDHLSLVCLLFVPSGQAAAYSSEYLSPYFFIFAFIPFVAFGPLGVVAGLSFSKDKTALVKVRNSAAGVIIGYLFSYGLVCLYELLQL